MSNILYYYISFQRQDKAPWRVVRVWNGQHKTVFRYATKEGAQALAGGLPTQGKPHSFKE